MKSGGRTERWGRGRNSERRHGKGLWWDEGSLGRLRRETGGALEKAAVRWGRSWIQSKKNFNGATKEKKMVAEKRQKSWRERGKNRGWSEEKFVTRKKSWQIKKKWQKRNNSLKRDHKFRRNQYEQLEPLLENITILWVTHTHNDYYDEPQQFGCCSGNCLKIQTRKYVIWIFTAAIINVSDKNYLWSIEKWCESITS